MGFKQHRPQGYTGKGDKYLPDVISSLKHKLTKARGSLISPFLSLPGSMIGELANVLVEFAEDIHNDIGIWKSLEHYNFEFFGTRLPLVLRPDEEVKESREAREKELNKYRIRHLLWVLYSELVPGLIFPPEDQDLSFLTEMIADFLKERFSAIPQGSGVKAFLSQPQEYGWDMKRKLLWLGRHSYLFRHNFVNYVEEQGGKADIATMDDFICQATTSWSGLGVTDILAEVLEMSKDQKADLRSWYERHLAYYRILAVRGPVVEAMNLISNKPYTIRAGEPHPFKVGQVIFGSLTPWNKEWYWSGGSVLLDNIPDEQAQKLRADFLRQVSHIAYRYCDQLAEQAREKMRDIHRRLIKYHGDDLVIYPDGPAMQADWQKQFETGFEFLQPGEGPSKALQERKEHAQARPIPSIPPELMEAENGIGVYLNPDEGQEIILEFNHVASGLQKKGIDLNEDELHGIRGLMTSGSTSPGFVKRLVRQYGDESIAAAFFIDRNRHRYYLDYLLRRYKGHFFRNRYPSLTFAEEPGGSRNTA